MTLVVAGTPHTAQAVCRAVGPGARVAHSTEAFAALDGNVEPVVVVCHGRIRPQQVELLVRFERERPWVPVVLVADPDPELARQLLRVRTSAIVWFTELETHIRRHLDAVRGTWGLWSLADACERSALPPALGKALGHAARRAADRPVRSVRELARDVGCAPVTLFRQFGARAGGATTLSRFIGGLSVLRVYELRRLGLNWKRVMQHTRLGRATLTRRIKAWPGCTPGELEGLPPDRLFAAFTAEHVRPILPAMSGRVSAPNQE